MCHGVTTEGSELSILKRTIREMVCPNCIREAARLRTFSGTPNVACTATSYGAVIGARQCSLRWRAPPLAEQPSEADIWSTGIGRVPISLRVEKAGALSLYRAILSIVNRHLLLAILTGAVLLVVAVVSAILVLRSARQTAVSQPPEPVFPRRRSRRRLSESQPCRPWSAVAPPPTSPPAAPPTIAPHTSPNADP